MNDDLPSYLIPAVIGVLVFYVGTYPGASRTFARACFLAGIALASPTLYLWARWFFRIWVAGWQL